MNTATAIETATIDAEDAASEVWRHAMTIRHLCTVLSEQDALSEECIALGHAIRAMADYMLDLCNASDYDNIDWPDILCKAGNVKALICLLRDKAHDRPSLALTDAIEQLAELISIPAGVHAP